VNEALPWTSSYRSQTTKDIQENGRERCRFWLQILLTNPALLTELAVFVCSVSLTCRSQWPNGLRHEMSSPTRKLRSLVRIPLKAWMSLSVYSVFVLGSGLATGWSLVQGVLPTILEKKVEWNEVFHGCSHREVGVRIPVGSRIFFHAVQTGSGAHPVSYPMCTGDYFTGDKVARVWSWPPQTSV
jgi:hypothetical protein